MPFSAKQMEYFQSASRRWNFKYGATRSGKTYMDFFLIPKRIRSRIGKDGLCVIMGVSQATIERNILEPMRNIWPSTLIGHIGSNNTCKMFGETVHCLGAEKVSQVSKLRGSSIKYCYGDEVADWSQDVFQLLKSRLDKPYSCFDGALNPQGPNHWLKEFLESDADIYSQKYTLFDNPFLPQEFVENLCREYRGTVFYERYVLGNWALAEGLIYQIFTDECIVPTVPREYSRYVLSMDYGIQNPTAILLWGYCGGVWYQVKEYYHSGRETRQQKTDLDYYEDMEDFVGELPIDCLIIDPSAASYIALVKQRHRFKIRRANNEVLDGIQKTAAALQMGLIKVNDCCRRTIEEYGTYSWDEQADDKPIKENDHAMDATRYFVNTMRLTKKKRSLEDYE